MDEQYNLLFWTKPKHYASPLEENDHPELDKFLDENVKPEFINPLLVVPSG